MSVYVAPRLDRVPAGALWTREARSALDACQSGIADAYGVEIAKRFAFAVRHKATAIGMQSTPRLVTLETVKRAVLIRTGIELEA